ncbi:MAG: hypothetical protein H0W68_11985, partial [Gemmatimonadaceae bacterium]|nr:hypothetical protein [Gemmatimonadaceae bacterium]
LGTLSLAELQRWVEQLDPARAGLGRTQLLRAIEIALLTGRRVSDLHRELVRPPRWRARYLLVDPGAVLGARIQQRSHEMLRDGWRAEVRALMETVPDDAPAWNASGYRTIRALERGEITQGQAEERVIVDTRQYAKRQRTWFRHQLTGEQVTAINPLEAGADRRLAAWWSERAS